MIHDSMLYNPLQGQGHGGLKVAKMAVFKVSLLHKHACNQKTNGELTISKFLRGQILIFVLVGRRVTFNWKLQMMTYLERVIRSCSCLILW